jgi:hypothetical protein
VIAMNDERRRILQLVADGKITAEEAAELLDAINVQPRREQSTMPPPEAPTPPAPVFARGPAPVRARSLIIQVIEGSNTKVDLRIPFGLARAAGKFIPRRAEQQLREFGIDLEDLLSDLRGSENGTILQVQDEDSRVLIAVE